jgi:hypothetical protein
MNPEWIVVDRTSPKCNPKRGSTRRNSRLVNLSSRLLQQQNNQPTMGITLAVAEKDNSEQSAIENEIYNK